MNDIEVMIVDDEPHAVQGLVQIVSRLNNVVVTSTAQDGRQALKRIDEKRPHVLLLDIEMPGMNGFELVSQIAPDAMPELIFVTAFEEFALQAFEVHAFDYLLKPVDENRLRTTMNRIMSARAKRMSSASNRKRVDSLVTTFEAGYDDRLEAPKKIKIRSRGAVVLVPVEKIAYIESAGNYVRYYVDGECYLSRSTMKEVEMRLESTRFIRIHRSFIVNIDHVHKVSSHPAGEFSIKLLNGVVVNTGNRYRDQIRALLKD